ncbi:hypothetical protein SKAU_G00089230 [Synaphobranchus kaupii]|uniref:Uncharacterized protein n=1 Tax=Synaphobranchus kaupii TaxID=118154 RepID=A0A9Q1J451_SYNKA|nr:hypothetical protein SKAU_G00089230 [Synaphobranchus kaupii]
MPQTGIADKDGNERGGSKRDTDHLRRKSVQASIAKWPRLPQRRPRAVGGRGQTPSLASLMTSPASRGLPAGNLPSD